ncbi:hypothetical protein Q1695_013853 [Nippostrongylus brasiliensis]|nr:hypothetical protein Q1695_013853 [Nippostrongylus brasiliensis]
MRLLLLLTLTAFCYSFDLEEALDDSAEATTVSADGVDEWIEPTEAETNDCGPGWPRGPYGPRPWFPRPGVPGAPVYPSGPGLPGIPPYPGGPGIVRPGAPVGPPFAPGPGVYPGGGWGNPNAPWPYRGGRHRGGRYRGGRW